MSSEGLIPGRLLGGGGSDDGPRGVTLTGDTTYIKETVIPFGHSKSPCCLCVLSPDLLPSPSLSGSPEQPE